MKIKRKDKLAEQTRRKIETTSCVDTWPKDQKNPAVFAECHRRDPHTHIFGGVPYDCPKAKKEARS